MGRILLVCGLVFAAFTAPASADPFDGAIDDCLEATPHAIGVPLLAEPRDLVVHVLLDGVSEDAGRETMERAKAAYAPVGIDLVAVGFVPIALKGSDGSNLLASTRGKVGGKRPPWAHLVYTLTRKNLSNDTMGDGLAGQAMCIGGVAFDDMAFAIGELRADQPEGYGPDIAAHELGHLMGAHHHYANCAEAVCSLMFNFVNLTSLKFSTVNSAVVRGHAEKWAPPLPPPPASFEPPPPPPPPAPAPPSAPAKPDDFDAELACVAASKRELRAFRLLRRAQRTLKRRPSRAARRRVAARRLALRSAERATKRRC